MRTAVSALLIFGALIGTAFADDSNLKSDEVYSAWLQMYDLKFDEAHRELARWQEAHPDDSLGPASDAAAYLFSELTRLGSLESALFVDDNRFKNRKTLNPDPQIKASFDDRIDQADRLADLTLQKSNTDARALFAKTLTHGLRADYVALIDGRGVKALSYTKAGRIYAERLLAADSQAFDAYLGPGVENYLLESKTDCIARPASTDWFASRSGSGTRKITKDRAARILSGAVRETAASCGRVTRWPP